MFSNILHAKTTTKSTNNMLEDDDLKNSNNLFDGYMSEEVLINQIRNTPDDTYETPDGADLQFAKKIVENNGKFLYCKDAKSLIANLNAFTTVNGLNPIFLWEDAIKDFFDTHKESINFSIERTLGNAKLALSLCESAIANEGNIILNSNQNRFRPLDTFPDKQIILVFKDQIKSNLNHAVSEFIGKHPDIFPFILDLSKEEKPTRFVLNKAVLNSRGTKNIFVFYCEETLF